MTATHSGSEKRGSQDYWGGGPQAEQQAGRMKQPLRVWALWPRETVATQQAGGAPRAQ